jgi:hypothetical protein
LQHRQWITIQGDFWEGDKWEAIESSSIYEDGQENVIKRESQKLSIDAT